MNITGTDFAGVSVVKFGSADAASFKLTSPTSITAVAPAEAVGRVNGIVKTPNGVTPLSRKARFKFVKKMR